MSELPRAPVERILKQAGNERVSGEAVTALSEMMEKYGATIAKEAHKNAVHAGRKTVKESDVRMAADLFN